MSASAPGLARSFIVFSGAALAARRASRTGGKHILTGKRGPRNFYKVLTHSLARSLAHSLTRSLAHSLGAVKFLYPLTQPLSDFGLQRRRLAELRSRLKWQIVGCELIECYQ